MKKVKNLSMLTMQTAQGLAKDLFFIMGLTDYPYMRDIITTENLLFIDYSIKDGREVYTFSVSATEKPKRLVLNEIKDFINQDIKYTRQDLLVVYGNIEVEKNYPYIYKGIHLIGIRYNKTGCILLDIVYDK
jgi:hypothetical protein